HVDPAMNPPFASRHITREIEMPTARRLHGRSVWESSLGSKGFCLRAVKINDDQALPSSYPDVRCWPFPPVPLNLGHVAGCLGLPVRDSRGLALRTQGNDPEAMFGKLASSVPKRRSLMACPPHPSSLSARADHKRETVRQGEGLAYTRARNSSAGEGITRQRGSITRLMSKSATPEGCGLSPTLGVSPV